MRKSDASLAGAGIESVSSLMAYNGTSGAPVYRRVRWRIGERMTEGYEWIGIATKALGLAHEIAVKNYEYKSMQQVFTFLVIGIL